MLHFLKLIELTVLLYFAKSSPPVMFLVKSVLIIIYLFIVDQ